MDRGEYDAWKTASPPDKEEIEVVQDSIGRDWVICPKCKKKTPGWGGGYGKRGNPSWICRWCGAKWKR